MKSASAFVIDSLVFGFKVNYALLKIILGPLILIGWILYMPGVFLSIFLVTAGIFILACIIGIKKWNKEFEKRRIEEDKAKEVKYIIIK